MTSNVQENQSAPVPGELLELLYEELRKLAAARIASEGDGFQTLQPTALVHEAWLRLTANGEPVWQNRAHFFSAVAQAMRRVLVDRGRSKRAQKRGAGKLRIDLETLDIALDADSDSLVQVSHALEELSRVDREAATLIQLRFFVGLDYRASAEVLGISVRTAKRLWTFGRAWLYRELSK